MLRCLTVVLTLAFATSLHAQQIRINLPKFALLINDAVVKELKLSAEQQERINGVLGDCIREIDGQKRLVIQGQTDLEAMETDCEKVLTAKQVKRLREAWLQSNGPMAITEEQLGKDLKVTEEQTKKAKVVIQKMNDELVEVFHSGIDPKEQLPKIKQLRADARKTMETLLTKEQLTKLTELQGAKIEGLGKP